MSLLDPLRNYCERIGPGLWDEPLNAFSNVGFFIAAWLLWRLVSNSPPPFGGRVREGEVRILIFLLTLIGIGSTLFHTFANGLTMLGDIIPIALFTFYYLWIALRRLVLLPKMWAALMLVLFTGVAALMSYMPPALRFNGSIDYFPCLSALFIISFVLNKRHHPAATLLLRAACLFAVSIILRSVDFTFCAAIPIGTHFIWHGLNACVLYLLGKAAMQR